MVTWRLINIPGPQMSMANLSHVVLETSYFSTCFPQISSFPQWSPHVKHLFEPTHPAIQTPIKTMGAHITTIVYLRIVIPNWVNLSFNAGQEPKGICLSLCHLAQIVRRPKALSGSSSEVPAHSASQSLARWHPPAI